MFTTAPLPKTGDTEDEDIITSVMRFTLLNVQVDIDTEILS